MARDDELEPISRGINLNITGGGGGLGGVAGVVVPLAVLGIVGIGAYVLYRKFTEDCSSYDKLVGRTVVCTKNEDCARPIGSTNNYICKPCGLFGGNARKCVACEGTFNTILNAFTGAGTSDSLSCMQQAGAAVAQGGPSGATYTPGVQTVGSSKFATGKSAEQLSSSYTTVEYQTICPGLISQAKDTIDATIARNSVQGTGATYQGTRCVPTTKDGAGWYEVVIDWVVPNGNRINTKVGETPYEYARRMGIPISSYSLKDPGMWWSLQMDVFNVFT